MHIRQARITNGDACGVANTQYALFVYGSYKHLVRAKPSNQSKGHWGRSEKAGWATILNSNYTVI
uniref:Shufflon protein C n=1 Tax=Heterorhabditis bacteriophora TaxID=37862 RepID=A0A1I7XM53_HETBA